MMPGRPWLVRGTHRALGHRAAAAAENLWARVPPGARECGQRRALPAPAQVGTDAAQICPCPHCPPLWTDMPITAHAGPKAGSGSQG